MKHVVNPWVRLVKYRRRATLYESTGGEDIATWAMTVCLAMWDTRTLRVLKINPQEAQENRVAMVPRVVTLPEADAIFSTSITTNTRAFSRHESQ